MIYVFIFYEWMSKLWFANQLWVNIPIAIFFFPLRIPSTSRFIKNIPFCWRHILSFTPGVANGVETLPRILNILYLKWHEGNLIRTVWSWQFIPASLCFIKLRLHCWTTIMFWVLLQKTKFHYWLCKQCNISVWKHH